MGFRFGNSRLGDLCQFIYLLRICIKLVRGASLILAFFRKFEVNCLASPVFKPSRQSFDNSAKTELSTLEPESRSATTNTICPLFETFLAQLSPAIA